MRATAIRLIALFQPFPHLRAVNKNMCGRQCGTVGPVMTMATDTDFIDMRVSKVVAIRAAEDDTYEYIVLDEVRGERHLVIQVGRQEAFPMAASLGGIEWHRPMTFQFVSALFKALAAGSARSGSIGWWMAPMPPPSRSKDRSGLGSWTRSSDAQPGRESGRPGPSSPRGSRNCESRQRGDSAEAALAQAGYARADAGLLSWGFC
jgi:hypothetical protein